jgi:hypothetical protein
MITLQRNIATTIFEFLPDFDFFALRFIFSDCEDLLIVVAAEHCQEFVLFSPSVDLPQGVYQCEIYGKQDDAESLVNADYIRTERIKIVDALPCIYAPAILDADGNPIADIENLLINYRQ